MAISVGTLLLFLPFSTKSGHISLVDALFTATSGVCVTGLVVQDTATYFTTAGKIIILTLFQLGGLGIMTFSTLILLVAGRRISIKDRILIQEGYQATGAIDVKSVIKNIFFYAVVIEAAGALSLFIYWRREFPWPRALFNSIFHSVSAFCNAGLSLFSDSFLSYRGNAWVNITIIVLIVLGGLGFLVLQEIKKISAARIRRQKIQISLHTKLVLAITSLLIVCSFILFLAMEWNQSLKTFTVKEKVFSSLFQVITPRTAGFNTLDLNSLGFAAVFLLTVLMFVGASPGSTGGGIKTSTVGVIFAFLKSRIAARESVNFFYRTLPLELVTRAFMVVTLAICIICLSSFILFLTQPAASMREIMFEVFSAFGTVGLSLGITEKLNTVGKIVIVLTMYIGRIGPLTLLYAFSRQKPVGRYEYVEESVMIG